MPATSPSHEEKSLACEWEHVKRSRDIFMVNDYRDNHPDSVFRLEIDSLYNELRDEVLADMKKNPTEYSKDDVDRFMAADIFTLNDFFDNELMTEESWENLNKDLYLPCFHDCLNENSAAEVPEGCTDVYFFGMPGCGKTSLLMGLSGACNSVLAFRYGEPGGDYILALQQYLLAGVTPAWTPVSCAVANGVLRESGGRRNNTSHPINLVEMSGEEFALRIADFKEVTLANMGTGATNLLKNSNRKVFFIIIDPTRLRVKVNNCVEVKDASGVVTGYEIRRKCVSQLDIMNKLVGLFCLPENAEIMKRVDAIHFVVTKADTLGETESERRERAKELLLATYRGPVKALKNFCRHTKRIDRSTGYVPQVFTFSLGRFYAGNVFSYVQDDSCTIADALLKVVKDSKRKWWQRLFSI